MEKTNRGKISTSGNRIRYQHGNRSWEIDFREILVIGECTNPKGPFFDDYFLCFITNRGEQWFEASFYSEGKNQVLDWLEDKLHGDFDWKLYDSADFKSRVMWPHELENQALFEWREAIPRGRISRILRRFSRGPLIIERWISGPILEYVRGKLRSADSRKS